MALIWGAQSMEPRITEVVEDSAVFKAGLKAGDLIIGVNDHKVRSWDVAQIRLYMKDKDNTYKFTIKHENGKVEDYEITPDTIKNEDTGEEQHQFGFKVEPKIEKGFLTSVKYAFKKFGSLISTMWLTVVNLFTGKIALNNLSGPVGIYSVVGQSLALGLEQVIYLIAFLSINVGLINILPLPAFDGGRIFFLIIEKIKGSPINQKFENWCHTIFFFLLILLMIYITIFDIIRL